MHDLTDILSLAYKKERAAARKLQLTQGLEAQQALLIILQHTAGKYPLSTLLEQRRQEHARQAAKAMARSLIRQHQRQRRPTCQEQDTWLGWFDGSAHPNPGRIGIGALLQAPDGQQTTISRSVGQGDSSMAEYLALHALLDMAVRQQTSRLIIYGDSRVVIDDVLARTRRTAIALAAYRQHALSLMAQLPDMQLIWVPRHRNLAADALARNGIRQAGQHAGNTTVATALVAAPDETQ